MKKVVWIKNKKYIVMESFGCYWNWRPILATNDLKVAAKEIERQCKLGNTLCRIFQPKKMQVTVKFED